MVRINYVNPQQSVSAKTMISAHEVKPANIHVTKNCAQQLISVHLDLINIKLLK